MAVNTKLKISNFAKDIGVKSKDLVDILKAKGIDGKSASSSLEGDEVSIILSHFTKSSTVSDIGAYLTSKKEEPAPEPKKEEPAVAKAEESAPAKAEEKKPEDKEKKD